MRKFPGLAVAAMLLGATVVALASASQQRLDPGVVAAAGRHAGWCELDQRRGRRVELALLAAEPDQLEQRPEPARRLEPAVQHPGHPVQPGGSADLLPERPAVPGIHPGCRRDGARYRRRSPGTTPGPASPQLTQLGQRLRVDNTRTHVVQREAEPRLRRPAGRLDRRAEREDGRAGLDDVRDRGGHLRRRDRRGVGAVHAVLRRPGHERRPPLGAERRREPVPRAPRRVRREDGQAALADVEPAGSDPDAVHPLLGQPGRGRDRRRRRLVDPGRRSRSSGTVYYGTGNPFPETGPRARGGPVDGVASWPSTGRPAR